jgi:PAS domain S-box-containing protein
MDWMDTGSIVFCAILLAISGALLARSYAGLRREKRVTESLFRTEDGFMVIGKDFRIGFANQKAAEILGTGNRVLTGRLLSEVLPQGRDSQLYLEISKALSDRSSLRFESFHNTVNRWFEHHVSTGTGNNAAVSSRDITSRKRLEGALRASEERFSKLIDSNIIGVLVTKSEYVMEANDRFLEMLGYVREDLLPGRISCREITPEHYDYLDLRAHEEMLRNGTCSPFEKEFIRKDSTRVPVLVCATVIGGDSSAEALFLVQDLSKQKKAERLVNYIVNASRILESSLDDEQILESLANFLVESIAEACVIYVREDNKLRRVISAATNRGVIPAMRDVEGNNANLLYLEAAVKAGRSELWGGIRSERIRSCALVPMPARDGGSGLMLLTSSKDNAFGDDDLQMLHELGRRAGVALENARLYRQANEASRLKDEFVAIVSHELRTPLTPILGATYMLRNERHDERVFNRAIDLIERNAKAQAKIVEDLLDVSRILSGKLRLNWELVDMESVVSAAIDTIRTTSEAKGVHIETHLKPIHNLVRGDNGRLQQVVWNLLANSVKFTPSGGRITIDLEESNGFAEVRVTDTGAGIGADFLPHVFDRFRQEDASRTRMHGGLGLGLAIVRHLVESHGGSVHALSSGDGQGSTFVVRLPVKVMTETARTVQAGD